MRMNLCHIILQNEGGGRGRELMAEILLALHGTAMAAHAIGLGQETGIDLGIGDSSS